MKSHDIVQTMLPQHYGLGMNYGLGMRVVIALWYNDNKCRFLDMTNWFLLVTCTCSVCISQECKLHINWLIAPSPSLLPHLDEHAIIFCSFYRFYWTCWYLLHSVCQKTTGRTSECQYGWCHVHLVHWFPNSIEYLYISSLPSLHIFTPTWNYSARYVCVYFNHPPLLHSMFSSLHLLLNISSSLLSPPPSSLPPSLSPSSPSATWPEAAGAIRPDVEPSFGRYLLYILGVVHLSLTIWMVLDYFVVNFHNFILPLPGFFYEVFGRWVTCSYLNEVAACALIHSICKYTLQM